ncbi:MAG: STAS domain-containing protein [Cardiobacteriaceae bacterium]|nr:STAS domain-containing protein [Cardiobacteriaceae bacterium]
MTDRKQSALGVWKLGEVLQLHPELTRYSLNGKSLSPPKTTLPKRFVIDGSQLNALDSVGLAALCVFISQAQQIHSQLDYSWHNMPPIFQQLAKLYHLPFNLSSD